MKTTNAMSEPLKGAKGGRPKKDEADKRSQRMSCYVTEASSASRLAASALNAIGRYAPLFMLLWGACLGTLLTNWIYVTFLMD